MAADRQSRKWQITINNPLNKGFNHKKIEKELSDLKTVIYYCMADEQAQTYHTHIYLCCSSPVRFSTLKKRFPEAHLEIALGNSQQNRDYIAKSGKWENDEKHGTAIPNTFEEGGQLPYERPGARSDLAILYEMVKDGFTNFEIMEANPDYMLRMNDIERVRQTIRAEQFKNEFRTMNVTYIWGKTGTGKSRYVMELHGYDTVFRVTDYTHPFDTYAGQDILALDEYRSQFRIYEILNYLDGYPLELPCRYANKVACFSTVYIISNVDLHQQYPYIQIDQPNTWGAFLRRVHRVIQFFADGHKVEYTIQDYLHGYIEIDRTEVGSLPFDEDTVIGTPDLFQGGG